MIDTTQIHLAYKIYKINKFVLNTPQIHIENNMYKTHSVVLDKTQMHIKAKSIILTLWCLTQRKFTFDTKFIIFILL